MSHAVTRRYSSKVTRCRTITSCRPARTSLKIASTRGLAVRVVSIAVIVGSCPGMSTRCPKVGTGSAAVVSAGTDAPRMLRRQSRPMPLRVLLVDDDERFRARAHRALTAEGIEIVAEVDTGAAVLAAAMQWQPDVVLLDLGLPDIDGVEVARRLQAE